MVRITSSSEEGRRQFLDFCCGYLPLLPSHPPSTYVVHCLIMKIVKWSPDLVFWDGWVKERDPILPEMFYRTKVKEG